MSAIRLGVGESVRIIVSHRNTEARCSEAPGKVDACGVSTGWGDVPANPVTCNKIKELPWF